MAYKVSYIFKLAGDYDGGWSENFHTNAGTPSGAMAKAEAMMPLLMAVHGAQTRLTAIRLQSVTGGRKVAGKSFNSAQNDYAIASSDSDIPTTRLQLKTRKGDDYETLQWLGGIPDDQVKKSHYTPTGPYTTAMNALLDHIKNPANLWYLRVLSTANGFNDIQSLTKTGIVTVAGHGYQTGHRVLVSRTTGIEDANGEWLIDVLSENTFQLRDWGAAHEGPDSIGNGRVKRQNFVMVEIDGASIGKVSKHNVGRPSNQFSGRRRRRKN